MSEKKCPGRSRSKIQTCTVSGEHWQRTGAQEAPQLPGTFPIPWIATLGGGSLFAASSHCSLKNTAAPGLSWIHCRVPSHEARSPLEHVLTPVQHACELNPTACTVLTAATSLAQETATPGQDLPPLVVSLLAREACRSALVSHGSYHHSPWSPPQQQENTTGIFSVSPRSSSKRLFPQHCLNTEQFHDCGCCHTLLPLVLPL